MINSKKTFILGGIAFLLAPFWLPSILSILGWYVNTPAWEAAQMIVEDGKDVNACKRIIIMPWRVFSPSTADQRIDCIGEYAALTKDPTACEKLMPSSLGWSCLGRAQTTADACSTDYKREVSWKIGKDVYDWDSATFDECKNGTEKSTDGIKCCYILKLQSDPQINDCSQFKNDQAFMNTCLSELALKTGNQELCKGVTDENKRVICELQAKYK